MNEKSLFVSIAALVIVAASAFGFGYYFSKPSAGTDTPPLGAITVPSVSTTTHGTALQSSLLFQWQSNAANTFNRLNLVANYVSSTAVKLNWPSLADGGASSTIANVTSTAFAGVSQGDLVMIALNSTSSGVGDPNFWLSFTAYGCSTNTVCIRAYNASSSAIDLAVDSEFNLKAFDSAGFVNPGNTRVTTTTTPYSQ